ncbi:protoporphyrinogen oxidase-like [Mytilus galloprovincialis]|uniref:protoporphyrinogen oxidase-like n=1 Tax=Mytilus galloprovincialis TaxID=29158 RepID=UPI003F7C0B49
MTAVILGGGVSGLASAYYLVRNSSPFKRIILLEASDRLGGWIQTSRLDNGAIFEHGPRSLRPAGKGGKNTLSLATELGLSNDIIAVTRNHPSTKNRYIYMNKKLNRLAIGGGFKNTFYPQPPFSQSVFSMVINELRAPVPVNDVEDESIHSFFSRRIGQEVADYLLDPVFRGIFAGDISKLSVKSCLPMDVLKVEKEYKSLMRGVIRRKDKDDDNEVYAMNDIMRATKERWSTWSFQKGMQQLSERLEDVIIRRGNVEIRKSTPCRGLEFNGDQVKVITDTESITADHVVSSIFSQDLSKLLGSPQKELANLLNQITAVSCIVVNVEYKDYMSNIEGFGHLLPSSEDPCVLGVIYDSSTFRQHDAEKYVSSRYTMMLGGAWYDKLVDRLGDLKESTIQDYACKVLSEQLDIKTEPSNVVVTIQKNCIPQYFVGHSKLVESIDKCVSDNGLPLSLVGSSYKGVSVNDCINNAKLTLKQFDHGIKKVESPDAENIEKNSNV